jgi:hypothetical protein
MRNKSLTIILRLVGGGRGTKKFWMKSTSSSSDSSDDSSDDESESTDDDIVYSSKITKIPERRQEPKPQTKPQYQIHMSLEQICRLSLARDEAIKFARLKMELAIAIAADIIDQKDYHRNPKYIEAMGWSKKFPSLYREIYPTILEIHNLGAHQARRKQREEEERKREREAEEQKRLDKIEKRRIRKQEAEEKKKQFLAEAEELFKRTAAREAAQAEIRKQQEAERLKRLQEKERMRRLQGWREWTQDPQGFIDSQKL